MQIFGFIIVGGIATVIDWTTYYIFCKFFLVSPYISNIIAFFVSVIFNYYASSKWVFNFKNNSFISFIILSAIGLLLTEILLYIFIDIMNIDIMISKVLSTCVTMAFNFITRKILLEKKEKL